MNDERHTPPPPEPPPEAGGPPPSSRDELIMPPNPPKDPVIILVLNLILVCVGYLLMGQWQKGLAFLAGAFIIAIPTCGFGVPLVAVFTAIDGFMQAQQQQAGHPLGHWTFFQDHR